LTSLHLSPCHIKSYEVITDKKANNWEYFEIDGEMGICYM